MATTNIEIPANTVTLVSQADVFHCQNPSVYPVGYVFADAAPTYIKGGWAVAKGGELIARDGLIGDLYVYCSHDIHLVITEVV